MTTTTTAGPLDAATVMRLQAVRGYPAVSLLLSTTPGPVMTPVDEQRLRDLHARAAARLAADEQAGDTARLLERLEELVDAAVDSRTGRAVEPAPVLAWHIRTVFGDALWGSEAGVPLPGGGTVDEWVEEMQARIAALAAWRPFDGPGE